MMRAFFVAFLVLLAIVLFANRSESVFGADASGYMNLARMLDEGRVTRPVPAPWLIPLGFVPVGKGMASYYPIGLPLHLLAAARVGGWEHAPFFVSPLAALALVVLTYCIGRQLHSEGAGVIAAVMMGTCAVVLFQALQPMSDVVAAMWSAATISAALASRGWQRATGNGQLFAILAGFCLGMAVLVRPTSMLLVAPLAFALPLRPRTLLLFVAGGAPAALLLGWYNLEAFGSLTGSGYAAAGAASDFALRYFPSRAMHYLRWTFILFGPLTLIAAIAGLRQRVLLMWLAAFFLFYSFYLWYAEWWYTRFLIPAYPALAVAAGIAFAQLIARWRIVGTLIVVAAITWEARQLTQLRVFYTDEDQHEERVAVQWAGRALPPSSLVMSMELSGSLVYYTSLRPVRWDLAPPGKVSVPYALLMQHEEAPFFARHGQSFVRARTIQGVALFVSRRNVASMRTVAVSLPSSWQGSAGMKR